MSVTGGDGLIEELDRSESVDFICVNKLATHSHLLEDEVGAVEVKHDVELTDAAEVTVKRFNTRVDELKHGHLVLIRVSASDEKETGVATEHHRMIFVLEVIALLL